MSELTPEQVKMLHALHRLHLKQNRPVVLKSMKWREEGGGGGGGGGGGC